MICKNCGTEYSNNERFCPACGADNATANHSPRHYQPNQSTNYNDSYSGQQNTRTQAQYQQPVQPVYITDSEPHYDEHVSIGGWIGRWILMWIPLVNVVMLFVWAFGGTEKYSLKTWARARLIVALISVLVIAILVIVFIAMGGSFNELLKQIQYNYW